jgi:large subunit ribosomal protein L4
MARLGTKQSPLLRGGGKSFGPKPRDFATGLPRKIYDLAWRTALSYRYRKGELIICEDGIEISNPEPGYVKKIFEHNRWGREHGKSLVITESVTHNLFSALRGSLDAGRAETVHDVDVKDLLGMGRLIIEKGALDRLIREHRSDLGKPAARAA